MTALLIACVSILLWLAAMQRNRGQVRDALAWAFIGTFGLIAGLTELLSLVQAIDTPAVLISWILTALLVLRLLRPRLPPRTWLSPTTACSGPEKALLCILLASVAVLLAIALAAPPTTADAYSYHIPRVYRWISQGSVRFFPSLDDRLNVYQPLAEFAILHLRLLGGSDRLFNLVQWTGLVASLIFVSLLARELGLNRRGQLLAAALAVTIPMAILQATSCQTDLIAASFCLALTYGLIRLLATGTPGAAAFCGLALGTALLSKGTSYFFCLSMLAVFGLRDAYNQFIRSAPPRAAPSTGAWVRRWALIAGIAMAINAGFFARNLTAYGHPLGTAQHAVASSTLSWHLTRDNLIRNLASHLATPFPAWNQMVATHVIRHTGPGPLFGNLPFAISFTLFEDDAGNLPHLLLASLCILIFPWRRGPGKSLALNLLAVLFLSTILLCTLLLWQPWITRFHTFLFLLLAPVCAWTLDRRSRLGLLVAAGLWCYALPFLFFNVSRPVIDLEVLNTVAPSSARPILRFRPSVFRAPRLNQCFGRYVDDRHECEAAMRWLPDNPQTASGICNGGCASELYLWLVAEQKLHGKLPRFVPALTPSTPPTSASPAVIFDTRIPDQRQTPHGYQAVFEGRILTVWKRSNPPGT